MVTPPQLAFNSHGLVFCHFYGLTFGQVLCFQLKVKYYLLIFLGPYFGVTNSIDEQQVLQKTQKILYSYVLGLHFGVTHLIGCRIGALGKHEMLYASSYSSLWCHTFTRVINRCCLENQKLLYGSSFPLQIPPSFVHTLQRKLFFLFSYCNYVKITCYQKNIIKIRQQALL